MEWLNRHIIPSTMHWLVSLSIALVLCIPMTLSIVYLVVEECKC